MISQPPREVATKSSVQAITTGTGRAISSGTTQARRRIGDWTMSDGNRSSAWTYLGQGNGWKVVGSGDYNGDGTSDILWYNAQHSRRIGDWTMYRQRRRWRGPYLGQGQRLDKSSAVAIITATGRAISSGTTPARRASATGRCRNNHVSSWTYLVQPRAMAGQVAGSGDYNGDGTSDILWYNTSTTTSGWWEMASNHVQGWHNLGQAGAGWRFPGGRFRLQYSKRRSKASFRVDVLGNSRPASLQ